MIGELFVLASDKWELALRENIDAREYCSILSLLHDMLYSTL